MRRSFKAILIVLSIVFSGCVTQPQQKDAARNNLAFLYNPSSTPLHPEFNVYHENFTRSRIYIKIFPVELLFNQANSEGTYQAKLRISYELTELIDGRESEIITDSTTTVFTLRMNEVKNVFVANLPMRTREGSQYMLKVNTTDLLRNKGTTNFIHVDRSTVNTAQNYMVISAESGYPSFDKVFHSSEIFYVQYNKKGVDTVYVKYYRNTFPLPRPPVTNLSSPKPDFRPDSIFTYSYSDTVKYALPQEGMYHIQVDPQQPGGLTLYNFGDSYPRVANTNDMIGPLSYLASSTEFNELANQTNKKLALDNFWLQAGGNAQSARELIRVYYNRVFFANYFFTSYKEGWKTDRGMLFIVYGPPNILTKKGNIENWVYYRKKSNEPLQFTFSRHDNPYTQNDYLLERNFVNSLWTLAVRDWRSGKIFYTESN
ncbi:MAG: GWxTD domain-containing protein [Bacteroidales bacterium]|nr:GWxTD domain-containing protein [Bacteroidales bacterium]